MVKINRYIVIERKRLSTKDIDDMTMEELEINKQLIEKAMFELLAHRTI